MPGRAPVEKVGGNQDRGPWPEGVEEIVEGKTYRRPVELDDDTTQELEVTVTSVVQLPDEQGNPTDGYAVTYQYDDPTQDGGSA